MPPAQERLAELMRAHLAGGGIILAATHGPLGSTARRSCGSIQAACRAEGRPMTCTHDCAGRHRSSATCDIAVRVGGGALIGVLFFLIVVTLMPVRARPRPRAAGRIGPAILWLGALLASLLALDRLFAADHEDGSLDLILMGRAPLELVVAAKGRGALAHHRPAAGHRGAAARPAAQPRAPRRTARWR